MHYKINLRVVVPTGAVVAADSSHMLGVVQVIPDAVLHRTPITGYDQHVFKLYPTLSYRGVTNQAD